MQTRSIMYGVVVGAVFCVASCGSGEKRQGLDPRDLEHVTTIASKALGGAVYSTALSGEYAFLGANGVIWVYKLDRRNDPVKVGELVTGDTTEGVTYMQIRGSTLYYADHHGTHIVDISDPSAPIDRGLLSDTYFEHEAMRAAGETANLIVPSKGNNHVNLYDLSDPFSPVEVGAFLMLNYPESLTVEGNSVYVGTKDGLTIWDISDLTEPKKLAYLQRSPGFLLAVDQIVYCGAGRHAGGGPRAIVDASNPSDLVYLSLNGLEPDDDWMDEWTGAYQMQRSGDFLYVVSASEWGVSTEGNGLFYLYDISDRLHPKSVDDGLTARTKLTGSRANQFVVGDDYLLIARNLGLEIYSR